jgi:hypothetical protein
VSVDLRPRAAADATTVVLDGEAVIHRAARVHTLDPVATLVWRCCDGSASVAEIAADLAAGFGADARTVQRDVEAAVSELADLGLLEPAVPEADPPGVTVEPLVDPPGSCAACAERVWEHRRTLLVGGRVLTVGTNDARADAAIVAGFAGHLVPEPPALADAPPFLAVELHERVPGVGLQRLDVLLRRDTVVARARRHDRILRALAAEVASYGDLARLGLVALRGTVAGHAGRALLVPDPAEPVRFRRELARHGVLVADQGVALVDPSSVEVVVGAPGLDVDADAFDRLAAGDGADESEPPPLAWDRYALVGFGVASPPSAAAALLAFGPDADDRRAGDETVDALCSLVTRLPVSDAVTPDAIAARLGAG